MISRLRVCTNGVLKIFVLKVLLSEGSDSIFKRILFWLLLLFFSTCIVTSKKPELILITMDKGFLKDDKETWVFRNLSESDRPVIALGSSRPKKGNWEVINGLQLEEIPKNGGEFLLGSIVSWTGQNDNLSFSAPVLLEVIERQFKYVTDNCELVYLIKCNFSYDELFANY